MRKLWTAFWQLSKSERVGIIVLVILLSLNITADWWMLEQRHEPVLLTDELAPYLVEQETASMLPTATSGPQALAPEPAELFPFDINTIDSAGLTRLGVSARSIAGLMRYRSKGGKVKDEGDFDKLFSLSEADKTRLRPWLRIPQPANKEVPAATSSSSETKAAKTWVSIDLNTADSVALVQVPGIGPTFASRILKYRTRLGGYLRLAQLAEVYGIDSSRFEQIAPFLTVQDTTVVPLSINTATEAELAIHPYIGRRLARQIVAYREQHGAFATTEALLRIHGLDSLRWNKLQPYLEK